MSDHTLAALAERLGDALRERWTPELRERAATAPLVLVELEGLGRVRARLLGERDRVVRIEPGAEGLAHYGLALVAVEGETEPRWIASERVVVRGSRE